MTTRQTYGKRDVDALPVGRRPVDIAELAPGVTSNTFAAGQLIVGGAFGFDNIFMVNGVDVNDNLFGSANDLFIEDAILETSVLAHGVSASYGRFSGGVVNVVTKSGGNSFSGSFRQNLSNPAWIAETPRQKQNGIVNPSRVSKNYEGTMGGPVVRDRLWFFSAGRYENSDAANTFTQTGGSFVRTVTNKRGELKLTGTGRTEPHRARHLHQQFNGAGKHLGGSADRARRRKYARTRASCRATFSRSTTTVSSRRRRWRASSTRTRRTDAGTTAVAAPTSWILRS